MMLPVLRTELELTDADLALVNSAFIWTYTLFQVPGAIWGQRLGSRRMLTLSAVVWAVITALMGLLPWTVLTSTGAILSGLVVLRFLMGAAEAPLMPLSGFVIYTWFPVGRWAVPGAVSFMLTTLGFAAAGPGVALLADRYGWEASFYLTAPLGLGAAALWWWDGRDYRPSTKVTGIRVGANPGPSCRATRRCPAARFLKKLLKDRPSSCCSSATSV